MLKIVILAQDFKMTTTLGLYSIFLCLCIVFKKDQQIFIFYSSKTHTLSNKLVRNRRQLYGRFLPVHNMSRPRLCWLSLQLHERVLLLCLLTQLLVLLNALQEVLPALRVGDVLDADIDPLRNDFAAHSLVDDDAHSVCGDVEHSTSFSVVGFVGHPLLNGPVAFDVYDVAYLVGLHVSGEGNDSMFSEFTGEQVSRTATVTLRVRHLLRLRKEVTCVKYIGYVVTSTEIIDA